MHNILAKSITVEDESATKPVFVNVPALRFDANGALIEDGPKP
jgi:hypothetical protein